jgi:hypothetical protein
VRWWGGEVVKCAKIEMAKERYSIFDIRSVGISWLTGVEENAGGLGLGA